MKPAQRPSLAEELRLLRGDVRLLRKNVQELTEKLSDPEETMMVSDASGVQCRADEDVELLTGVRT
jgi:predicted nuclease with TOPRIM domain